MGLYGPDRPDSLLSGGKLALGLTVTQVTQVTQVAQALVMASSYRITVL